MIGKLKFYSHDHTSKKICCNYLMSKILFKKHFCIFPRPDYCFSWWPILHCSVFGKPNWTNNLHGEICAIAGIKIWISLGKKLVLQMLFLIFSAYINYHLYSKLISYNLVKKKLVWHQFLFSECIVNYFGSSSNIASTESGQTAYAWKGWYLGWLP